MYTSLSWFSDQTKDVTPRVLVLGHFALHKPSILISWTNISTTMISVLFWYHGLIYCLELWFLTPYCDIKPFGIYLIRVSSVATCWPSGRQHLSISSNPNTPLLGCQYDNLTNMVENAIWSLPSTARPVLPFGLLYPQKCLLSLCHHSIMLGAGYQPGSPTPSTQARPEAASWPALRCLPAPQLTLLTSFLDPLLPGPRTEQCSKLSPWLPASANLPAVQPYLPWWLTPEFHCPLPDAYALEPNNLTSIWFVTCHLPSRWAGLEDG